MQKVNLGVLLATLFVLTRLSINNKAYAAEAISYNPSSATCGNIVTFQATGLDPSITNYEIYLQCTDAVCVGQGQVAIGQPSGMVSYSTSKTFNVDGVCPPADINIKGGTYAVFLTWTDSGGVDKAAAAPVDLNVSTGGGGGSCSLTSPVPPPEEGSDVIMSLTNGNVNTQYDFLVDGAFQKSSTTTSVGEAFANLGALSKGTYTISADSQYFDVASRKNCTTTVQVLAKSGGSRGSGLASSTRFPDPLDPQKLVEAFARIMIPIAILISLLRAALGGYKILMSQGNEQALTEGKEILTSAIIGLIVSLVGLTLLDVLISTIVRS